MLFIVKSRNYRATDVVQTFTIRFFIVHADVCILVTNDKSKFILTYKNMRINVKISKRIFMELTYTPDLVFVYIKENIFNFSRVRVVRASQRN